MPGIILQSHNGGAVLPSAPITLPITAQETALYGLANLNNWLEFAPGLLSTDSTKLFDRKTRALYASNIALSAGSLLGSPIISPGSSGGTAGTYPLSIGAPPAGGVQAVGTFIVASGTITSAAYSNPGKGYVSAPAVSAPGAGLSGAVLTAYLDTIGGQPTGIFSGAQQVDLGNAWPLNQDFTLASIANPSSNSGFPALWGGKALLASFWGLYSGSTGRLSLAQNGATVTDTQTNAVGSPYLMIVTYTHATRNVRFYKNSTTVFTSFTISTDNTLDAGLVLGNMPNVANGWFKGAYGLGLTFSRDLSTAPADLAVIKNYAAKFGL